jgi:hypothetical protein
MALYLWGGEEPFIYCWTFRHAFDTCLNKRYKGNIGSVFSSVLLELGRHSAQSIRAANLKYPVD